MSEKVKDLLKRAETLKGSRSNFETAWQEIAEIFRPIKADITVQRTSGDKSNFERLFESFPIVAVDTLASILNGTLTNKSSKWFNFQTIDEELNEDKEVSEWLSEATDIMWNKMYNPSSGFEENLLSAFKDIVSIGTTATLIEEGKDFDLNYITLNIRDFLIAENKEGKVDYVIIKSKKTARQIIQEWGSKAEKGEANIHKNIIEANKKDPFTKFDLQLHILPREERDKSKIDAVNKPIAGIWIDEKNQIIIEETGWNTMPAPSGRTERATGELYGTSRAMIALPDARQMNQMSKDINEAAEKILRPPLNVNSNYSKRINLSAAALNYPDQKQSASGRPAIEKIIDIGNIPINENLLARKQENIREVFFLDKLKVFDNPNATATQVLELRAESFRIMSPFSVGLQPYLDGVLSRTFDILFRKSFKVNDLKGGASSYQLLPDAVFKELPEALKAAPELKINFVNPINQAQQVTELNAIDTWLQSIGEVAQLKPEILDLVNVDEIARKKRTILNIDPELINDKKAVDKIRNQRQEQAQQEQELSDAERMAAGASNAKQAGLI